MLKLLAEKSDEEQNSYTAWQASTKFLHKGMQSYQLYTGESWQEALYQVVKVNASSDKTQ